MQERVPVPDSEINRELLSPIETHPKWFFITVAVLALIVATAGGALGWMINQGSGRHWP